MFAALALATLAVALILGAGLAGPARPGRVVEAAFPATMALLALAAALLQEAWVGAVAAAGLWLFVVFFGFALGAVFAMPAAGMSALLLAWGLASRA
jgi:hypothetical protein